MITILVRLFLLKMIKKKTFMEDREIIQLKEGLDNLSTNQIFDKMISIYF
jgi:hypothetical protein